MTVKSNSESNSISMVNGNRIAIVNAILKRVKLVWTTGLMVELGNETGVDITLTGFSTEGSRLQSTTTKHTSTASQVEEVSGKKSTKRPANVMNPADNDKVKVFKNGLAYEDVVVGTGAVATNGKLCMVRYKGMLSNGSVFDVSRGPFSFKLGSRSVIPGFEMGVSGMKEGGIRKVVIPPHLGYKDEPQDKIPANSELLFELELVRIK